MSIVPESASRPEASHRHAVGIRCSSALRSRSPYPLLALSRRLMNLRHLLATSAATALLSPLAHAAGDTAPAQPAGPAEGADLPTISVTDTRHLPESFDRRYASTQVLTRDGPAL